MTKGQEIAAAYDDVFVRDTAPLAEEIDAALRTAAEEARAKALEEVGITPSDLRCLDVAIGRLAAGEPVESVATDYDGDELRRWIRYVGEVQTRALADGRRAALEEAAGVARKGIRRAEQHRGAERIAVRLLSALYEVADLATLPRSPAPEANLKAPLTGSPAPEAEGAKDEKLCRCGDVLHERHPECSKCGTCPNCCVVWCNEAGGAP